MSGALGTLGGMDGAWLAAFVATNFLFNITPGPAVVQVVGHSIGHGARAAQASIAGILLANAGYMLLSALGLGAVILAAPVLFDAVKWLGMAYLAWLGLKGLRRAARPPATAASASASATAATAAAPAVSRWALFRQSALLQGANPKSVLFFCALLPTFAGPADHAAARIVLLGLLAIALEYPVLAAYSLLASGAGRWLRLGRASRWLDAVSGAALIGAACGVASTSLRPR